MEKSHVQGGTVGSKGHEFIIPYLDIDIKVKEKWCPRCRKWLPFSEFFKNKTRFDGYGSECRKCNRQYVIESKI